LPLIEAYISIGRAHERGIGWQVSGNAWNLVAATLCTISAAGIAIVMVVLTELTLLNVLVEGFTGVGALGGVAWIIAAAKVLRRSL
jgi:hypothetical protein